MTKIKAKICLHIFLCLNITTAIKRMLYFMNQGMTQRMIGVIGQTKVHGKTKVYGEQKLMQTQDRVCNMHFHLIWWTYRCLSISGWKEIAKRLWELTVKGDSLGWISSIKMYYFEFRRLIMGIDCKFNKNRLLEIWLFQGCPGL